jgi:hypothetical protein
MQVHAHTRSAWCNKLPTLLHVISSSQQCLLPHLQAEIFEGLTSLVDNLVINTNDDGGGDRSGNKAADGNLMDTVMDRPQLVQRVVALSSSLQVSSSCVLLVGSVTARDSLYANQTLRAVNPHVFRLIIICLCAFGLCWRGTMCQSGCMFISHHSLGVWHGVLSGFCTDLIRPYLGRARFAAALGISQAHT